MKCLSLTCSVALFLLTIQLDFLNDCGYTQSESWNDLIVKKFFVQVIAHENAITNAETKGSVQWTVRHTCKYRLTELLMFHFFLSSLFTLICWQLAS